MSFASQITAFTIATKKAITEVVRDVVISIGDSVITLSPVDTGRFKGNWQMTVNTPSTHSLVNYDGEGSSTLAKIIAGTSTLTAGQVAYIVNNLEYGYEIEVAGWAKTPAYMPVRLTEARFQDLFNAAVTARRI